MQTRWWKESVVYQIYPRSFNDSNGDGIGDLRGIIEKLDYLKALGIDVVWLSPVYQSPNADMGYDISDYQAIMGEFGTLADWEEMVNGLHARGIRLIMDLVVNHTSDEHPWFVEARKFKDSPYRDYYIWKPGSEGREPNNWRSFFGGPAWSYDELTGEYFLHLFSERQPDLNWENPRLRADVHDMMRWWLDMGVDGFRMDVINLISKSPALPDARTIRPGRYQPGGEHFIHGPRLMEFLDEMKNKVLSNYDTLTVGEAIDVTPTQAKQLTHAKNGPLDMVFHFEHMRLDHDTDAPAGWGWRPWNLRELKDVFTRWQHALEKEGWNSQYLSCHDQPRQVSRFGDDSRYRVESAKLLATLLHLLHGTPYIFQGEEIGMTNIAFSSIDEYRDIHTHNHYRELVEECGLSPSDALKLVHLKSRDNGRAPMQWDATENGGFTTGKSWIGVNPNYREINVARAMADPDSIFHYYRKLIRLRKTHPVIIDGRYELILGDHPSIFAFTRTLKDDRLIILLNFSSGTSAASVPADLSAGEYDLLIGNYSDGGGDDFRKLSLRPYEARVYRRR